uniref:Uncharacterized protein n=1 Tax=Anguilla anguilla TaxID=7936 RepID=A0A0E9XV86_ANGAN
MVMQASHLEALWTSTLQLQPHR